MDETVLTASDGTRVEVLRRSERVWILRRADQPNLRVEREGAGAWTAYSAEDVAGLPAGSVREALEAAVPEDAGAPWIAAVAAHLEPLGNSAA